MYSRAVRKARVSGQSAPKLKRQLKLKMLVARPCEKVGVPAGRMQGEG